MTNPKKPAKRTAEDAYTAAHIQAQDLLERLNELLQNRPAPDTTEIHWGHVGDLQRFNDLLRQAAEFLSPKE